MSMQEKGFSIVIIPDTQNLSNCHSELYPKMTKWIRDHVEELNLKMVLHLGDVVNHGAEEKEEYEIAAKSFESIYAANLPILIAMGNHDYDNLVKIDRSSSMFNRYFGEHLYRNKSYFGGTFHEGKIENCYAKLEIEGQNYLFLSLEFGPRDEVLAWADQILESHSDYKAIIITHCYMYMYGERSKPGDRHNPKIYNGATGANDGEDQWQKCFKKHGNIIGIFSGHQIREHISYRIDEGEKGNTVFQSFQNWQNADQGGEGRIRIINIKPYANKMGLSVFNTNTEEFERNDGYEVIVPFKIDDVDSIRYPR